MKELIKTLRAVKYSHDNVHLLAADVIEQLLAELDKLKQQEPAGYIPPGDTSEGASLRPYKVYADYVPVFFAAGAQQEPECTVLVSPSRIRV